jgi:beta-lactamase class A
MQNEAIMWTEQVEELIDQTGGTTSVLVKNPGTGEVIFSHNPDTVYLSASVIKVPIMDEARAGRIGLTEAIPVTPIDMAEGG